MIFDEKRNLGSQQHRLFERLYMFSMVVGQTLFVDPIVRYKRQKNTVHRNWVLYLIADETRRLGLNWAILMPGTLYTCISYFIDVNVTEDSSTC